MHSNEYTAKLHDILESSLKEAFSLSEQYVQKSHLDFMSLFILALMAAKSVQYQAIAAEMEGEALEASKMRRIQHFMAEFDLDYTCVAYFMLMLLSRQGKITFCLDRTEWSFGETTHNILVLTAYSHGVGIPIWFECVNENGGCCDVDDKIYMMLKCLEIVGKERIKCLIADSEFIGNQWIAFLMKEGIVFYLDVRSNQYFGFRNEKHQIEAYMKGKSKAELRDVYIFKQTLHLGIKRQKECTIRKRKAFLAVVTNATQAGILTVYKNRWSIEVLFQSLKKRGFDIQATHLDDPIRLRKLFALVAMAFIVAFTAGLAVHAYKPIPVKNHGYKENSFFRKGKDFLRTVGKSKGKAKNKIQQKTNDFQAIFQIFTKMLTDALLKVKTKPKHPQQDKIVM
jgi:Transposase DDE domain